MTKGGQKLIGIKIESIGSIDVFELVLRNMKKPSRRNKFLLVLIECRMKQLRKYSISSVLVYSVFFLSRIVLDVVNDQPFSWRNVIWGVFFFFNILTYRKKHLNKKLEID